MQPSTIPALLADQAGVLARRQLLIHGYASHDLRRWVRRRDLAPIHPGVYVDHSGPPTWLQRAWAALLAVAVFDEAGVPGDVALSHESAIRAADGPGRRDARELPLHVAIGAARRVQAPEGVVLHRMRAIDARVHPVAAPPRIRYDDAVLDSAIAATSRLDAIAVLAGSVGARRTAAGRLLACSRQRRRLPDRAWLEAVLEDVATGTHSVLEHGYRTRVERAHGLPASLLQHRTETPIGVAFRDAAWDGVVVELDGRLHHHSALARDADLDRDLHAAVAGERTVRLGWGQVFARPCGTAAALAGVLRSAGYRVDLRPCSAQCPVPLAQTTTWRIRATR